MLLKHIKGENSPLFAYLRFCAFARVSLCLLVLLVVSVRAKSFRKKNKEFKTALIANILSMKIKEIRTNLGQLNNILI